jgi:hypothetical protein
MKRYLILIAIFIFAFVFIHAQGLGEIQSIEYKDPNPAVAASTSQLDASVKTLADGLNKKLGEVKAAKVSIGQIAYRGNIVPLGTYWVNQLTENLVNIPNKTYAVLSAGTAGADFTITGEIIDTDNTVIRVYTRLIRTENRAIEASIHFDFEKNQQIINLLIAATSSGGGRSSSVAADALEPDSFESPVAYEIGADSNAAVVNRTIHSGDEDFFALTPANDGQLIMETTGSTDTYMEFYRADNPGQRLAYNDDGGSGSNARIRYSVQAGTKYIAKVKGCDSSDVGSYGFRAWITVRTSVGTFDNPVPYEIGAGEDAPTVNNLLESDDEHYYLLLPANDGQLIMETTGSTDTYMEFYDGATRQKLAQDDDGGRGENARIRYNVEAGKRYVAKVRGYDGDSGSYGFHAWLIAAVRLNPDQYEPDNDSASAKQIEVGATQQRTFHNANDVDWVKFQIARAGRYTINVKGAESNRLDTYFELFDSKLSPIDEDDDGGEGVSSRLTLQLEAGLYYLKIECLDDIPNQPYTVSIESSSR